MKLFWTPASPFVRKVMVAAIELGLDGRIEIYPTYWPHEWGSRTIAFDPEFISANPVGRIPALITEEGVALVEFEFDLRVPSDQGVRACASANCRHFALAEHPAARYR